jgi:mannose-6-phosphate isomerase-like protein (cupin superfamily)
MQPVVSRKALSAVPSINSDEGEKVTKKGFVGRIEHETTKNKDFRRVLYTGKYSQLVLMCLKPGEEIGMETHDTVDQFFRFEEGHGIVSIDGVEHEVKDGDAVIVPSGAAHNVVNNATKHDLKLYTLYSPPEHRDQVIRHTKAQALEEPEEYDGKPTE